MEVKWGEKKGRTNACEKEILSTKKGERGGMDGYKAWSSARKIDLERERGHGATGEGTVRDMVEIDRGLRGKLWDKKGGSNPGHNFTPEHRNRKKKNIGKGVLPAREESAEGRRERRGA